MELSKYTLSNSLKKETLSNEEVRVLLDLLENNTKYPGSIEYQIREKFIYVADLK
jgi:hypothetical protein